MKTLLADRFAPFGTTIFSEMTALANKHGAVNLAQGFPDFDGPEFVKRAAMEALAAGHNQYARMSGVPALNAAIAGSWLRATGQSIDSETQVTITSGCTEALAAAMLGVLNPGDEVILFEPYYDSYRASAAMAGAVPRFVTLRPPMMGEGAFTFDEGELRAAFTPRTKAILVNTPHNPSGKVFSRGELEVIAKLCVEHGVLAITDEVYEHLVYSRSLPHVRLATIPGMEDRTLTLSSLGKSFSLTGWKIGWSIGAPPLARCVRAAHQFLTFATATPLQWGAAAALSGSGESLDYLHALLQQFSQGREQLAATLRSVGFRVFMPDGAYFIMADWTAARLGGGVQLSQRFQSDVEFCRFLTQEVGVAAIPPSVFYEHSRHGRSLARFAFCKRAETLAEADRRLRKWACV